MVEIIPKKALKQSKKVKAFLYFTLAILLFSVLTYFTLNSLLQEKKERLDFLKVSLIEIMTPENVSLEQELFLLEEKIDKFSFLVERHLEPSAVFEIIENKTHPQIWFEKFDFNSAQSELSLSGETQSFITLWQQILIFKEEPSLREVRLGNFSINREGKIDFDLILFFKPETFKN